VVRSPPEQDAQETNVEESTVYLQRATETFAKVPASSPGKWGLDRIDEEDAAAPWPGAADRVLRERYAEGERAALRSIVSRPPRNSP
jgi:hypothetical protein